LGLGLVRIALRAALAPSPSPIPDSPARIAPRAEPDATPSRETSESATPTAIPAKTRRTKSVYRQQHHTKLETDRRSHTKPDSRRTDLDDYAAFYRGRLERGLLVASAATRE
jgi:hypothetical protein